MTHALIRRPIDICRQREEPRVVIGNSGVVRVLQPGGNVSDLHEGDLCLVFCNGIWDSHGYPLKIYGYDAAGSIGLLARRTKLHRKQLIPLPRNTRFSLQQWAAFSLRYVTAWANWNRAYVCLQNMRGDCDQQELFVWGWGGGTTFAELQLAKHFGCSVTMMASKPSRLDLLANCAMDTVDRRCFPDLQFCPRRYREEGDYRERYLESERAFLGLVEQRTAGEGVSIFVDFIGQPVARVTAKSLARPGVVTTAGWKEGMHVETVRAIECMNWHAYVHTHYARYADGLEAVRFAEETGWLPPIPGDELCPWEKIAQLGCAHAEGRVESFFPLYAINPV